MPLIKIGNIDADLHNADWPKQSDDVNIFKKVPSKLRKARIYVHSPSEAPEGVHVEHGPRGGMYYENTGKPSEEEDVKPSSNIDPQQNEWSDRLSDIAPEWNPAEELPTDADVQQEQEYEGFEELPVSIDEFFSMHTDDFRTVAEIIYKVPGLTTSVDHIDIDPDHTEINISMGLVDNGHDVGQMQRQFNRDGDVYHALFTLDGEYQGQGAALEANRRAEAAYRKMGFTSVSLEADIDVGKYAWAQQGYDFTDEDDRDSMLDVATGLLAKHDPDGVLEQANEKSEQYVEFARQNFKRITDRYKNGQFTPEEEPALRAQVEQYRQALIQVRQNHDLLAEDPEYSDEILQDHYREKLENGEYGPTDHSWDIAALDSGSKYGWRTNTLNGTGTFGKAAMLAGSQWHGAKDLSPDSLSSQVGDVYYQRKRNAASAVHNSSDWLSYVTRLSKQATEEHPVKQPFQLPKGVKPKPGQTDAGFFPGILDEDDRVWARAIRALSRKSSTKPKTDPQE